MLKTSDLKTGQARPSHGDNVDGESDTNWCMTRQTAASSLPQEYFQSRPCPPPAVRPSAPGWISMYRGTERSSLQWLHVATGWQ